MAGVLKPEFAWLPLQLITPTPTFICHAGDCEHRAVARHAACMMAYCAECAKAHDETGWDAEVVVS